MLTAAVKPFGRKMDMLESMKKCKVLEVLEAGRISERQRISLRLEPVFDDFIEPGVQPVDSVHTRGH